MEMESPISSETTYHSPGSYQNTLKSEHSNSKQPPQGDNHSPQGDINSISHHSPQGDNNNNSNSQTNGIEAAIQAVKRKCYQICLQWLLIAFAVFFVIAKASKIGMKILKDPTSSTCLRIIYFGLEAIHVFMVYNVLRLGPQLPFKKRFQIYVMLFCCGGFTTAIMSVDSPFDMWGWTPIVSGGLWLLAGVPMISRHTPILPF